MLVRPTVRPLTRAASHAADAVVGVLARLPWPVARFVVRDRSMVPALLPGDRLLVVRWPVRDYRRGDVAIVRDPEQAGRYLVKRLAALPGDLWPPGFGGAGAVPPGRVVLLGDNRAESRDSRAFGAIPLAALVGRAAWRYLPAARRGRVTRAPVDGRPG